MSDPVITQADWLALAAAHGRAQAELLVWQRIAAERDEQARDLREQLAALSDRLYRPPDDEGGPQ